MTSPDLIYKIFKMAEWREREIPYKGSPDDLRDGFIHFSTAAQLPGTLARIFSGENDVLIAEFKVADLSDALKWEEASNGENYPHLYRPLNLENMTRSWRIAQRSGAFVLPEELGGPLG
ncbi:MAG: DUF952 domain-containing protein [Alphaproteobacteria bacterium]|nr:MAG: DUF952 domain-containing protein [Alphaproteobacteria bacterium]